MMAVLAFKQPLDEDDMPDTKSKPSGKLITFPTQPKMVHHSTKKKRGGEPKKRGGEPRW